MPWARRIAFRADRGGHVPCWTEHQATSVAGVYAVGDCAGILPGKSLFPCSSPRRRTARGRRSSAPARASGPPSFDLAAYRLAWVRASVIDAAGEPYVCQCEEVTARDILEVRPPRYLGWPEDRRNTRPCRCCWAPARQTRSGQASDAGRHGIVPGPALPRADRGPSRPRRRCRARCDPARHASRPGASAEAVGRRRDRRTTRAWRNTGTPGSGCRRSTFPIGRPPVLHSRPTLTARARRGANERERRAARRRRASSSVPAPPD